MSYNTEPCPKCGELGHTGCYQAALTHAVQKDAEIERLGDKIIGLEMQKEAAEDEIENVKAFHTRRMLEDNARHTEEIARLQRGVTEALTHLNNEPAPRSYHVANAMTWLETIDGGSMIGLKTACMNFYDSWHGAKAKDDERLEFASVLHDFVRLWQRDACTPDALTHAAQKDAEIDRLKQSISRHEIGGSKLAADNMNLQAEIERLQRVVGVLQKMSWLKAGKIIEYDPKTKRAFIPMDDIQNISIALAAAEQEEV